jgi:hypothetical protein
MATIFGSIETLIHDSTQAVIDSNITAKMSDMFTGFVSSGFGIVDEGLKIVRDITASPPAPSP